MNIREAINIIEDLMSKRFDYEGDYWECECCHNEGVTEEETDEIVP